MALLVLQAAVAALALLPSRTDPAYRATYLDHTADCWRQIPEAPIDVGGADVIAPSALSGGAACALLPKGWNPADAWGVWSNGPVAEVHIPLRPGDKVVTLHLRGFAPNAPQSLQWSIPGGPMHQLNIPEGTIGALAVQTPPDQGLLRLTLHIQHVHRPLDTDVSDWRSIGVALIDITRSSH